MIPERARVAGPLVFRHQTPVSTGRTLDTSRNGQRVNSIAANSGTRRERGYEIDLVPPAPSAGDVQHSIKKAMERNAKLDADSVSVDSSNGTITLHGTVSSWADHDEAVAAAWAAPGVTDVKDRILVAY